MNEIEEDQMDGAIIGRLSEEKRELYFLNADRTIIDFDKEIKSLINHEHIITRPRLSFLTNQIYIPKFRTKSFCAYFYNGETDENYNDYTKYSNVNFVFNNGMRSQEEYILGVECTYDDSCASIVNSFGKVFQNSQISIWDEHFKKNKGVDPKMSLEKHKENLPKVLEEVINKHKIQKGDPNFKGIAVPLGPGQIMSVQFGIEKAQELALQFEVPLIPVSHIEGHIMTTRFATLQNESNSIPKHEFPFISLLVTGAHTEIVLTRGVGLHTILGITIDNGIGEIFDKAYIKFREQDHRFNNKEEVRQFVKEYNDNDNNKDKIPDNYFDFLNKLDSSNISPGLFLEKLAKFGDPTEFELPIGLKRETNADMSFTGLKTAIQSRFYEVPDDRSIPFFERKKQNFTFKQLCNLASSAQSAAFLQLIKRLSIAMQWCEHNDIPFKSLNVVGGVSCNKELIRLCQDLGKSFNVPTYSAPPELCTDNAMMNAWMGWELLNAQQEIDARNLKLQALRRIPLGSYVEGLISLKAQQSKIMVNRQLELRDRNMKRRNQGSFKEVNNLFSYSCKDPSVLTSQQKMTRLYKGTLRKLMSMHVFSTKRPNFDRFYDEQYRVRRDFDKIYNSKNEKEVQWMLEKYENFIEKNFEPYASMHECRPHSNLWGKMLIYNQTALDTDHIGFYKPVLINGQPTDVKFTEEYPHQVTGWVYDHQYLDVEFNYEDLEKEYQEKEQKSQSGPENLKSKLDQAHNQ